MKNYTRWNNILGWSSFLIALVTYILTLEPTVSWWDCGEFISCAYKLEVGHPPGAPLFLMIGRVFSLFASDPSRVAVMVNALSAIASAFTILFLFWTITHLAKKLLVNYSGYEENVNKLLIFGSGLTGALAYTFSDTFWFSAVEGEVYASSSLFTAVVFWAILKWENIAGQKHADRWLILIAYLMGLSIGVHLLNLLTIPALVLVYYFSKYKVTPRGVAKAIGVSILLLAVIMYGIINGLILIGSKFELLFVNGFRLPFNSGVIFYSVLVIGGIIYGIWYSRKKGNILWNSVLTGLAVIMIGYSSYAMVVIRSMANPPIDFSNPENVFSLYSYLSRETYGETPLFTGHYFDDEIERDANGYPVIEDGKATYVKDTVNNKYVIAERRMEIQYEEGSKLFPRIYSRSPQHIQAYRDWAGIRPNEQAGFSHNLVFFFNYQLNHMYFRYFMWNFAGKQNDTQSQGSLVNGNWISGIKFLDKLRLGNQDNLPDKYKEQPSRNKYYLLPLILGLLGLLFQLSKDKRNFWVVMFLFFFTGIAIVIYLNQTPLQPRERDYAFAGSFYAFAIWIGLGVISIYDSIRKYFRGKAVALLMIMLCLLLVPGLMAFENWDDHDRSERYTARDIAMNYLSSCEEDAVIYTNGDNDTYPLWYVQEVEGFRTDVRVVNSMLLNSGWYIEQMRRQAYESEPLPFSLPQEKYKEGVNNAFYMLDDPRRLRLNTMIRGIETNNSMFRQQTVRGDEMTVIPTNKFLMPVDSQLVVSNGTVDSADAGKIEDPVTWQMQPGQYNKSSLAQFDILKGAGWERPVCFVSGGNESAMGLEDYFQLQGLAFGLVPISTPDRDFLTYGRIDTDDLYEKLMNEFSWGGMQKEGVYLDHYNLRTLSVIKFRKTYVRLAEALLKEGRKDSAVNVLDRCMELSPNEKIPYDIYVSGISYPAENNEIVHHSGVIEIYFECGETEKARNIFIEYANMLQQDMFYYESLKPRFRKRYAEEFYQSRGAYEELVRLAKKYEQEDLTKQL